MASLRAAFVAAVAAGCALREITPPPGEERVVVQGVLNARASEQVLWIERITPAGDPIEYGLRPLAQPPRRVEVGEEGGRVHSFTPDTGNPARFVAAFTPVHGNRYDLLVEAQGAVIRGATVVPPAVTIVDPPADTISHAPGSALPVSWASGTSRDVAVFVTADTSDVSAFVFPQWVRDDTTVVIPEYSFSSLAPGATRLVWIVATDPVTAQVYAFERRLIGAGGQAILNGNVTGGVGVFGAVTSDRFVVRLQ